MPPGTIQIIDERNVADIGDTAETKLDVVCLQDDAHVGFMSMVESHACGMAEEHLRAAERPHPRDPCPASELVVGVQCGGSDAFSGVTANPAVGFCTDLLVQRRRHGNVQRGDRSARRHRPADGSRASDARAVAEAMIRRDGLVRRLPRRRAGVDRSANTTPGNKKGGLSNIVEKAMGSIVKSGSARRSRA